MTNLIPLYSSIIAALHYTVNVDISAFIIENLIVILHNSIKKEKEKYILKKFVFYCNNQHQQQKQQQQNNINKDNKNTINNNNTNSNLNLDLLNNYITKQEVATISNKLPSNALLLLIYLYNLRVIHHTLVVDIMNCLAGSDGNEQSALSSSNSNNNNSKNNSSSNNNSGSSNKVINKKKILGEINDVQEIIKNNKSIFENNIELETQFVYFFSTFINNKNNNNNNNNNENNKHFPSSSLLTTTNPTSTLTSTSIELEIELLEMVINHCGLNIRNDDPISLKNIIIKIKNVMNNIASSSMLVNNNDNDNNEKNIKKSILKNDNTKINSSNNSNNNNNNSNNNNKNDKNTNNNNNNDSYNSRVQFMFESLTDLKNNKSRRVQNEHLEVVKKYRKWLGGIKTTLGQNKTTVDFCFRVTLEDLFDAEKKGFFLLLLLLFIII
jgi:hypothetical protein